MKNKKHTINYIKRQAKSLKRARGISHTEALELLSKDLGYSNWQHCCRSLDLQADGKVRSENQDQRKIVLVNNVTPIHYTKRSVEKFTPGDKAWISWDGRKATPVTITEVDNVYYTLRIERPLKESGNEHFLRLDEVRSTPELACFNRVTS